MWTCPKCGEKIEDQFDSCWKCAGPPDKIGLVFLRQRQSAWSFFVFSLLMAFLAPLCADCLHSFIVVTGSYRFYNAELGRIVWSGFWIFVALRGLVSFLAIWFFARARFRDFLVWCCLVGLWTLLDLEMEIAIR